LLAIGLHGSARCLTGHRLAAWGLGTATGSQLTLCVAAGEPGAPAEAAREAEDGDCARHLPVGRAGVRIDATAAVPLPFATDAGHPACASAAAETELEADALTLWRAAPHAVGASSAAEGLLEAAELILAAATDALGTVEVECLVATNARV